MCNCLYCSDEVMSIHSSTHSIQLAKFRKRVLPLGLEIVARGLERVCLLLDGLFDHLPEALADGETQIARGHLVGQEDAIAE